VRLCVYGLWHLGCVTAACAAAAGHRVVGLDPDAAVVGALQEGRPPLEEPGLAELIAAGLERRALSFTTSPRTALEDAEVCWVALDTPIDERDEPDAAFVRHRLDDIGSALRPGTLVLVSSQVPICFTTTLAADWAGRGLRFAYSPENLRLGRALEAFRNPGRVIVGLQDRTDQAAVTELLRPFSTHVEWMSIESAEMTKHALNAFFATSVAFINEVARLCEIAGADARDVERGLKSERRIGPGAYLAPGGPFAGGTLARDLRALEGIGDRTGTPTPLVSAALSSNALHQRWLRDKILQALGPIPEPVVAMLGLAYTAGTSTLRRSASVETCGWLSERGVRVQAHDPAVAALPPELTGIMTLCESPERALTGADVAVVATAWPEYRDLRADDLVGRMRRPQLIDQAWFLADTLGRDGRITYLAVGRSGER
jgi:UDPglucose 6-dehydrogenase